MRISQREIEAALREAARETGGRVESWALNVEDGRASVECFLVRHVVIPYHGSRPQALSYSVAVA